MESVRGFRFSRPVPSAVLSEKDLAAVLAKKLVEDLPVPFPRYAASLAAVGLVEASPDLEGRLTKLYAKQVVGFYDPRERKFYVVPERTASLAGGDSENGLAALGLGLSGAENLLETALLTHELTHALQDQRLGLEKRLEGLRDSSDGLLALQCVLEGEATVVMVESLVKALPEAAREVVGTDSLLATMTGLAATPGGLEGAEGVPDYFVKELVFPYVAGTGWVRRLRSDRSWTALDESYRRLPTTTAEILHPERGAAPRAVLATSERPTSADLPAGARILYPDTLGEWTLRTLLERDQPEGAAAEAAAEWRDDRILFYERDGETGFVWRLRLASPAGAARVANALRALWSPRSSRTRPLVRTREDRVEAVLLVSPPAESAAPRGAPRRAESR